MQLHCQMGCSQRSLCCSGRAYASKESQREAADCVMDLLLTQTAPGGPLPCDRLYAEGALSSCVRA